MGQIKQFVNVTYKLVNNRFYFTDFHSLCGFLLICGGQQNGQKIVLAPLKLQSIGKYYKCIIYTMEKEKLNWNLYINPGAPFASKVL